VATPQKGFEPKGWLGLLLGTRIWYAFWGADQDDDAAFEHRLDSVVHEIGDRGKLMLPEAVPPFQEPTLGPAPALKKAPAAAASAPAPAVTPAQPAPSGRALAAVSTPQRTFSPSMQPSPAGLLEHQLLQVGGGGGLVELITLLREELSHMKEERQITQAKMEALHQEQHAKIEQVEAKHRAEINRLREAASKADQIRDLLELQSRLETLHAAKLLVDEELYAVEDIIAEEDDADGRVAALITLSGKMAGDGAFARQLRRKYA
jgi:hypothetical protein